MISEGYKLYYERLDFVNLKISKQHKNIKKEYKKQNVVGAVHARAASFSVKVRRKKIIQRTKASKLKAE